MSSIATSKTGFRRILFYNEQKDRKTVHLGKVSLSIAKKIQTRLESILSAKLLGAPIPQDDATWLSKDGSFVREKFESVGLLVPAVSPPKKEYPTVKKYFDDFIKRAGKTRKPGTVAVWEQVRDNVVRFLADEIRMDQVTRGHAKEFLDHLRGRELASLTIQKHIRITRQIFEDACDFELLSSNPFSRIRVTVGSVKSNVEVPEATVKAILEVCNPVWKVIIALSRYGGLRTPSETLSIKWSDVDWEKSKLSIPEPKVEHHEGRGVRQCPLFPELRKILKEARELAPLDAEFIVDKPAYRAAANTGTGWKNANLRTQFLKILSKAEIMPWKRLFHSMRASRQTELERQFPLHVVCAWLGNSPKIAQRSYLLVTEDDFRQAANELPNDDGRGQANTGFDREIKTTRARQKHGTKTTPQATASNTQEPAKTLGKNTKNDVFAEDCQGQSTDGEGFEPTVASRLLRFSRPVH